MSNLSKPVFGLLAIGMIASVTSASHAASVFTANASSYITFGTPLPTGLTYTPSSTGTSSFNVALTNVADATVSAQNSDGTGTMITDVHAYTEAHALGHAYNSPPSSQSVADAHSNKYNISFSNANATQSQVTIFWFFHTDAFQSSTCGDMASAYSSAYIATPSFTANSGSIANNLLPSDSTDGGTGLILFIAPHGTLTVSVWSDEVRSLMQAVCRSPEQLLFSLAAVSLDRCSFGEDERSLVKLQG